VPSASSYFLPCFCFAGNQYQIRSNRPETFWRFFSGDKDHLELGSYGRRFWRAPHNTRARPRGEGAPKCCGGPSLRQPTYFHLYKFPNIPETLGESTKYFFRRRKPLFSPDPIWRPFPVLRRRGNSSRRGSTSSLPPLR
jgi:hypothetical protein